MIPLLALFGALGGCDFPKTGESWSGLYDADPLNPFPNAELVVDGRLHIPSAALPVPVGGTPLPVDRLATRRGFSPVQPSVWLPSEPLDPESVGGQLSLGIDGPVRVYDLDAGAAVPAFAELDAHPDALRDGRRALLVRPMAAVPDGHRVAVVVTTAVHTLDGAPLSTAAWAEAQAGSAHYAKLATTLAELGSPPVALAWDFPVADATPPSDAILEAIGPAPAWTWTEVRTSGLPDGVAAVAVGSFQTSNWLVDDRSFEMVDGIPVPQADAPAALYAWLPRRMAETTDPLPVVVFGHGLLSDPAAYLEDPDDSSAVIDVANRLGAIVLATNWRGLTTSDLIDTIGVAADFGRLPELTDRVAQGLGNTATLLRSARDGALLDDPFFEGRADRTRVGYYGISLGGIEGAVLVAAGFVPGPAVLHVGGSDWSTLLERSSDWPLFEAALVPTVPEPEQRQVLADLSQLFWDPVDPAGRTEALAEGAFLLQESMGDDQVANLTTELLARSAGVRLAAPGYSAPYQVGMVDLPVEGAVLVQLDPQVGVPDPVNRPAAVTGAHTIPRTWEGVRAQTVEYLATGTARDYCGATGCDAGHTGQ